MPDKCAPGDPARCQASTKKSGQCENKALDGCRHCALHDGGNELQVAEVRALHIRDAQFMGRANALSTPEALKTLHTEIGIVSGLLEEALNECKTTKDRAASRQVLTSLSSQLSTLKRDNQKMEVQNAILLSKTTVIDLAVCVGDILASELRDEVPNFEQLVDRIMSKIQDTLINALNKEV